MTEDKPFQTALSVVQEKLKAPKSNRNTVGNYQYRSAEDILEAVKPLLFEKGLIMTLSDQVINLGDRYYIEATVTVSGFGEDLQVTGMARESEEKKGMDSAQITGAASSYARKYALNGMFCIDDTKDADTDEYANKNRPTTFSKHAGEPIDTEPMNNDAPKEKRDFTKPTDKQLDAIVSICKSLGINEQDIAIKIGAIETVGQASTLIKNLTKIKDEKESRNEN